MAYSIRLTRRKDKPNNDGLYAVRLCVTKNTRRKYFTLKVFVEPQYWDETNEALIILKNLKGETQKKTNDQRKRDNALLAKCKVKAQEIADKFEMQHIDWTLNQFEDAFRSNSKQGKFKPYFEEHIKRLRDTGHIGNSESYAASLRILGHFDKRLDQRLFLDIDLRYIRDFNSYLEKRGCRGNTRLSYFRAIRAILNLARKERLASESTYPFGKQGFSVSSLSERTDKRYLPEEYLQKIKNTQSQNPHNEYARQLFLFSYYCFGISFIDMALLTKDNIKLLKDGNHIVYTRHKIKSHKDVKPIAIQITEPIQVLMDTLRANSPVVDNYLLPIITKPGYSGEKLYYHIRSRLNRYSRFLKRLAQELEITDFNLTSYVSRHTAAMTLQSNKVAREVISQMLGHSDMHTTNTYLDSFDNSVINEAAKVL